MRTARAARRRCSTARSGTPTSIVIPALMVAAAVLARRNVKLGHGDRRGAYRAAVVLFATVMVAWLLRGPVGVFAATSIACSPQSGGRSSTRRCCWLTYLALEPYIRRYTPDSLIGWTRLIAGKWRDPRVAADVMIGVSAGLAMTVIYAVRRRCLPPLVGQPEPRPLFIDDPSQLLGTRHVAGYLLERIGGGIQWAMLCVVGLVALMLLLKRQWLAAWWPRWQSSPPSPSTACFRPEHRGLDLALGTALIVIFVATIVRAGLLATMAALTTHFVLLRAPLTLDLSTWRGPYGLWFLGFVAVLGLGACYLASARRQASPDVMPRAYRTQ